MFLLVPVYPGCPGSKAVKRSLFRSVSGVGRSLVLMSVSWSQSSRNQLARSARAQGPGFFLFEGPPTGCGGVNFLKLIILLLMPLHDRTNTSKIDLQ